jgi:hypothetical protein
MATKRVEGSYDPLENILHLWFPKPVQLTDERTVVAFFDEVVRDWIAPCPTKPYLLVNYANLYISASLADAYAKNIGAFQSLLLGTFRYAVAPNFTGVAVALGNLKLSAAPNIFPDEASAREAIRHTKSGVRRPR